MSYVIDCRKNWAMTEAALADETDPVRRRNLETIVAHAKAEAKPDFFEGTVIEEHVSALS